MKHIVLPGKSGQLGQAVSQKHGTLNRNLVKKESEIGGVISSNYGAGYTDKPGMDDFQNDKKN